MVYSEDVMVLERTRQPSAAISLLSTQMRNRDGSDGRPPCFDASSLRQGTQLLIGEHHSVSLQAVSSLGELTWGCVRGVVRNVVDTGELGELR